MLLGRGATWGATVRAALVDGRGQPPGARRAARLGESAAPRRPRAAL